MNRIPNAPGEEDDTQAYEEGGEASPGEEGDEALN